MQFFGVSEDFISLGICFSFLGLRGSYLGMIVDQNPEL